MCQGEVLVKVTDYVKFRVQDKGAYEGEDHIRVRFRNMVSFINSYF